MSALRINLLPAYIAEMRQTRLAIIGFSALFALAVGGSLFYWSVRQGETKTMQENADAKETEATAAQSIVTKLKGEATTLRAQIAPIGDKVRFVKDIRFYNTWPEKVYRRAAAYTDKSVEYSSMALGTNSLSMNAYVSKTKDGSAVDNLSRYLITFYGNPDVSAVSVTGPPGWERPAQGSINPLDVSPNVAAKNGFAFSVNADLIKSLQIPTVPATLTDAPGGAAGAAPAAAGNPAAAGPPPGVGGGTPGVPGGGGGADEPAP